MFSRRRFALGGLGLVVMGGCTTIARLARTPLSGGREAPPEGIDKRAQSSGKRAPDVDLVTHQGARWSLKDALASGPAVLMFYRGDW